MTSAKPLPTIWPSDEARFVEKVDRGGPDDCWPFTSALVNGYGSFRLGKRKVYAHRVAWVLWSGELEPHPSLQLDHQCHNPKTCGRDGEPCRHRRCCNPRHLRPSTPAENVANSNAWQHQKAAATHCPNGHEYTEANTRIDPAKRHRICRRCQADVTRSRKVLKGRRPDFDTHCINGHRWNDDNLRSNSQGSRYCRTCKSETKRRRFSSQVRRKAE